MTSTNETTYLIADNQIDRFDADSLKNDSNLNNTSNTEENDSKNYNNFVCDLIRKQIESENKLKTDISNLNGRIISHIYEKLDRGHSQIFDYKFRDYLLSIGYDRESTYQAINYLHDSYDGSLDLDELKSFYNSFSTASWNFKPDLHLKKLLTCSLLPGYLDAFSEDNTVSIYDQLAQKLYKFLLSHRLSSEVINEPYLENRILVTNLRRKILIEEEKNFYEESQRNKSVCVDQQCISNIKVCCSHEKIHGLTDGKSLTYWQTTNTEKCENHWILINLKENIKLTSLSLCSIGNKSDEFLKSVLIEIRAGSANKFETVISKCDYNLTLNNDYLLCSCFPNDQNINYLKIVFKRNSEKNYWGKNNDQIKIKSIKLIGKKEISKSSKITVQDASICWYFEMLSSMAIMQSQLMPSLHSKILQITKTALQNIPPLSLTLESKNTFLTPNVLEKVDSFLKNIIENTCLSSEEKSESILIYLAFNLARANLKAILNSLQLILENYELNYNFLDLITKIEEASKLSLRKTAEVINIKYLQNYSKSNKSTEALNETEIISTSTDDSSEFVLEPFYEKNKANLFNKQTCYNMLLEVEPNVIITDINLKIKLESIGVTAAVVILINSKEKPDLNKFKQFDLFDQEKYNLFIEKNKNSDSKEEDFDVCYFDFYENQIDILLQLPIYKMTNFILIKFIRQNENILKNMIISNVKVLGCKQKSFELYDQLKLMHKYSGVNEKYSASILINVVLWFLCQLAEQHKYKNNKNDFDSIQLLDFHQFEINDLWRIYTKALEIKNIKSELSHFSLKIPVLILLYELVNCTEIKSNLNTNSKMKSTHVLENLCDIIDSDEPIYSNVNVDDMKINEMNLILKNITKEIVKNGISVFFNEKEQRELFFYMIEQTSHSLAFNDSSKSDTSIKIENSIFTKSNMSLKLASTKLLFEAFCNLFCSNKLTLIQHITKDANIFETFSDYKQIIFLIDKLINFTLSINNVAETFSPDYMLCNALNKLINSIQSNLIYNIRDILIKNQAVTDCVFENLVLKNINHFLFDYSKYLINRSNEMRELLDKNLNSSFKLKNFYTKIVYNFVLWLSDILNLLDINTCTNIISNLTEFHKTLLDLELLFNEDKSTETEKLLKTWTFNSKTKSSIFDLAIDYCFPLATRFVVEFDTSSTLVFNENSDLTTYSFIDSSEKVHLFSGKIGSNTWPEKMEIKSNSYIILNIRSNKDMKLTSAFFLKFNVNAYGFEKNIDKVLFRDLTECLTSIFGAHLNRIYSERLNPYENFDKNLNEVSSLKKLPVERRNSKEDSLSTPTEKSSFLLYGYQHQLSLNSTIQATIGIHNDKSKNINDYNHELYRILLRGGLNKSNKNVYDENLRDVLTDDTEDENDKNLHEFLTRLSNYFCNSINDPNNLKQNVDLEKFMSLYDKNYENLEKLLNASKTKIGGTNLTEILLRLFCVLIWHNPSIKYADLFNGSKPVFNQTVANAYKTAESTRMFIVERQQMFKMKNLNNENNKNKTLYDILNEKLLYLLKFKRIPHSLYESELGKLSQSSEQLNQATRSPNDNSIFGKKKTPIPKSDSNSSINIIFMFLFDKNSNNLDDINRILNFKRSNSILIWKNFQIGHTFIENILKSGQKQNDYEIIKSNTEKILIFLSNYFLTLSSSQFTTNYHTKPSQNTKNTNEKPSLAKILFPPTLKSAGTHYLENLYACGLEIEAQVQKSFYNFIKLLLNYSSKINSLENFHFRNLIMRLDCYITCLLDIDWEFNDLEFVKETNLVNYFLKNTFKSLPICNYTNSKYATPNDILEDLFTLSKEKFNEAMSLMKKNNTTNTEETPVKSSQLFSLIEEDEDSKTDESIKSVKKEIGFDSVENESFDLKIFPKIYQSIFQTSSTNKNIDTVSLLKCVSAEIKTYENYEKYIVARYMFWKYFSKLNTNFYCDSCEVILTGNRYVCLECRDHCLCLNCFSKSIVGDSSKENMGSDNENGNEKPIINFISSSGHKTSHRMLVLDHMCNQCQSLIIGKRIRCLECNDYDLCLMCSKDPEYPSEGEHKKEHKTVIYEPKILVARSTRTSDAQIFLYLHSQFLYAILTLKLCELVKKFNKSPSLSTHPNFSIANEIFSNIIYLNLFMITQAATEENSKAQISDLDQNLVQNMNIYSFFNQENLTGLLASILRTSKDVLGINQNNIDLNFSENIPKFFNNNLMKSKILSETNIIQIIDFIINILNKFSEYDEAVVLMLIGILKSLLIITEPNKVDELAKKILSKDKQLTDEINKEYTLELMLTWIDNYMMMNLQRLASAYLNLLFNLNQSQLWRSRIINFLNTIFDNILNSFASYQPKIHSKYYIFLYTLNSTELSISNGQWIDYKNNSLYDGAGILRSKADFKIGLTKIFYLESFGYYINLLDPESRKPIILKNQKYDFNFKKSNENSKIRIKTSFDLTQEHIIKLIEILKKIFQNLNKQNHSDNNNKLDTMFESTSASNKQLMIAYETAHVNRKKEFNRIFKQVSLCNSLLLLSIITLIKDFILKNIANEKIDDAENIYKKFDFKLVDPEILNLISKLAFLNTNMNSNWKLIHLREFIKSLLFLEGFTNIKQSLETVELKENDIMQKSIHSNETNETPPLVKKVPSTGKFELEREKTQKGTLKSFESTETLSISKTLQSAFRKISFKDGELAIEDLKINLDNQAVIGICDISSLVFGIEDMINDSLKNDFRNNKRNKQSLKLLDDCLNKLSKFDSSNFSSSVNSANFKVDQTDEPNPIPTVSRISQLVQIKQNSCEPLRSAIKIVSGAAIVLSCRELLLLFINTSKKMAEFSNKKSFSIIELSCHTEYEFLQLLDILYYSDNLFKYKTFIKNLVFSLTNYSEHEQTEEEEEKDNSIKCKFFTKICLMACDFMLPEFKLIKKVTWSSEDKHEYDNGKLKNKINNEALVEENINFSSNQLPKTLSDIEYGNNLTSKPNDIEKLSTNDSSTLLILFDQFNKKNTQSNSISSNQVDFNIKDKNQKFNKFLKDSSLLTINKKPPMKQNYQLGDSFEYKKLDNLASDQQIETNDVLSDTESVDSIVDTLNVKKELRSSLMYKKKLLEKRSNDDTQDQEMLENDDNSSIYSTIIDYSDYKTQNTKKKPNDSSKKSSLIFQVLTKRRDSNYDSNNEEYEDNQDNDDKYDNDEDEDEDDDEYSSSNSSEHDNDSDDNESDKKSDNDDTDYDTDDGWTTIVDNNRYNENDDDKYKKSIFKLPLDNIENIPYLAIKNKKMLKWKFTRREESDWTVDSCSFKIYSTLTKNFESAYYLLDELVNMKKSCKLLALNDIWSYLIKICCIHSFSKRLKVLSLLIKIIQNVYNHSELSLCINLFDLKSLKNLQYTLESSHKEDRNVSRALFELFFFAEKLAFKWSIEREYVAKMRDKEEYLEKITETSYFINFIMNSLNLNENKPSELKNLDDDLSTSLNEMNQTKSEDIISDDFFRNHAVEEDIDLDDDNDENW